MDRNRLLGVLLGLAMLASVFTLPFGYRGARPLTLFELFSAVTQFIDSVPQEVTLPGYSYQATFVLLLAAGLLGLYPLASGVLALLTMASFSIVVYAYYGPSWGFGYYIICAESLAAFANGYISRLRRTNS